MWAFIGDGMTAATLPTVREQIVDRLRTDILCGALPAEEPVREQSLAERFGVGRGPIRDALLQLSQEGGLTYRPNRGMRVSAAMAADDRAMFAKVRADLEAHAVRLLSDEGLADRIDGWRIGCRRLKEACGAGDLPGMVEADMAFHRSLVEAADRPDLDAVWMSVTVRMRLLYGRHDDPCVVADEHAAIVEELAAGRRGKACKLLREHIG